MSNKNSKVETFDVDYYEFLIANYEEEVSNSHVLGEIAVDSL